MRRSPFFIAFFALSLLAVPMVIAVLHGSDTYAASCGGQDNTSIINCNEKDGNAIWSLLLIVVNVMAGLVGVAAIGGFVYAAILYTSAGDKSAQVTKAKETLANVVLGLVLFALMWAFLQFLIPGGVFGRDFSAPEVKNAPTARTGSGDSSKNDDSSGSAGGAQGSITPSAIKIKNFRDASATTGGKILKPGVLYRSAELDAISDKKAEQLSTLMGKQGLIVDLRLADAVKKNPDKNVNGVENVNIPIAGFTSDINRAVTEATMRAQFAKALKRLGNAPGPVLVHCVAGKDRTGWTVAMIMHIAGASPAQIKKEYGESTKAWPDHNPDWIDTGLSAAKEKYGSIDNYLKTGLGLGKEDITKIKNKFGA